MFSKYIMNTIIKDTYYDPSTGLQSAKKLFEKLKNKGVKMHEIKDFISKQETHQLNKQPIKINISFQL